MAISESNGIKQNIEEDMLSIKPTDSDSYITKLFKMYPLLGDSSLKPENQERIYENAKKVIDAIVLAKDYKDAARTITMGMHEQVLLATVYIAKKWNSYEEGKFTRYVAMQFGYRDDTGRIWGIITESIEKALVRNKRLFIMRNGDRQFYETIMVHSMGPGKAWFPLFDLLFSFYVENLRWSYIPQDPLFARLIRVLQNYFNNDVQEDDDILIASRSYRLRIGIRRLVQERPRYSALLFERIVKRMDMMVNNEAKETKHYYAILLNDWFADKISKAEPVSSQRATYRREKTDLAFSYKTIVLRYVLHNQEVFVSIPSIRLEEVCDYVRVKLYLDDKCVAEEKLDTYGNELGETAIGKLLPIPFEDRISDDVNLRAVISTESEVLFDSEKRLYRKVIVFSDDKEIAANNLKKVRYKVVLMNRSLAKLTSVDANPISEYLYEMSFHKDYSFKYDGYVIGEDYSEVKSIRVQPPACFSDVRFVQDGTSYFVLRNDASLRIYIKDYDQLKRYAIDINGDMSTLTDYYDYVSGNHAVVRFDRDDLFSLSVVDLENSVIIYRGDFIRIADLNYEFNRRYYLNNDLSALSLKVRLNGEEKEYSQFSGGNEITVEAFNGELCIEIPRIEYSIIGVERVFFNKYVLNKDIAPESGLLFVNHSKMPITLQCGSKTIDNPDKILFKDCINVNTTNPVQTISMVASDEERNLVQIVNGCLFATRPTITMSNDKLFWDGGIGFIGDETIGLRLLLEKVDGSEPLSYALSLGKGEIASFEDGTFEDGDYHWAIEEAESAFIIEKGRAFLGNESKVRFAGKRIVVNRITQDTEEFKNHYIIKPVYIDQISFVATEYVPSEEDVFDIYKGCLYWEGMGNEKRYFSFKYDDKHSKYKVNPVKIIYISDKYLRIVNEDDEGLLFYYNDASREPGWEITDFEPKRAVKGYLDALFYLYSTEEIYKKVKKVEERSVASSPEMNTKKKIIVVTAKEDPERGNSLKRMISAKQEDIITMAADKRIVVNAGPGTGKTWTLIEKIIYMVETLKVEPADIQVLCFSRAAVEVVRNRISDAISAERASVDINTVDIRTFDSFATQLLYWVKDSEYTVIPDNFAIEKLSYEERIIKFTEVIKKEPDLISRCRHFIVDEVQDLVTARAEMVLGMIEAIPQSCGVTLLGDACQAIYDYQVLDGTVSSSDFYNKIERMKQFSFYSFHENHRQNDYLKKLTSKYREPILRENEEECNKCLSYLLNELPEYDENRITSFEEDTLDRLVSEGTVGILTRSNAQALKISSLFRKKNIEHIVQRRAGDNSFAGWIGLCFNMSMFDSYDEALFSFTIDEFVREHVSDEQKESLWNNISQLGYGKTGRIPAKDLLINIRNNGRAASLFDDAQKAPIVISTIHRSKGREYDSVMVLDELLSTETDSMEEHRVNYVALTRAKDRVFTVSLGDDFTRTLDDRRCFSWSFGRDSKHILKRLEIGLEDDFDMHSFAVMEGAQEFLRKENYRLLNREVYLTRNPDTSKGYVSYFLKVIGTETALAETSPLFARDLADAIKRTKNLPPYASIYDYLYPQNLNGLFVVGFSSEIGMARGDEIGIKEYGEMIAWNTLRVEGFSLLEY